MSRAHPFQWREEEALTFGQRILRPTVDVQLSRADLTTTTKALIDTGSPRCVFPRGIGTLLAVSFPQFNFEADKKIRLMGREWGAVTAMVDLMLPPFDDLGWEAEVDFVLDEGLPFALLGYEGFLNKWAVSFNACLGYFLVEQAEDFHDRLPEDVTSDLDARWPDP